MKPTHFQIAFTNERIIPSGGLTLAGYILENSGFIDRLNKQDTTGKRSGILLPGNGDQTDPFPGNPPLEDGWDWTLHAHGESGQFHSEVKTDMDLERFPSGKFDRNELVLELAMSAYNILRMIGDESIGPCHPMKHPVKRRRIGTVIKNLVMMACHITKHARKTKLGLGKSNIWRKTFQKVYLSFGCL